MHVTARMIRREARARNGWNNGDLDVAFQLFESGMVWDGNLASKSSRDHLVANGYAVRAGGMQSLTGRGVLHFLTTPAVLASAFRRWRTWRRNPFVADEARIRRAMEALGAWICVVSASSPAPATARRSTSRPGTRRTR